MATVELTKENFDEVISGNDMVVVDFWASWCQPCRSFAPVFEAASEKHTDVVFAKVNVDEQRELAGWFQIRSIPTLMVFREQIILYAQPGALPASALEEILTQARALDMDEVRREVEAQRQAGQGEGGGEAPQA